MEPEQSKNSARKGRQPGATQFKPEEEVALVDIIYEQRPISQLEWENVANLYQEQTGIGRPSTSLKAKYRKLRDHPVGRLSLRRQNYN
jgi:hypothetical protein